MAKASEECFFFEGGSGHKLLGFLHRPRGKGNGCGVLYCHPFAEERNLGQAVAVRTARMLAEAGFAVMRFDFSGCGDSEGLLEDAAAEDWLAEIGTAAKALRERGPADRIGLWGLRAGANLAAMHGRSGADIRFALLWQPVPDLKLHITQFLRQKLASGLTAQGQEKTSVASLVESLKAGQKVEVMGYPISFKLYQSLVAADSALRAGDLPFPVHIVSISEAPEAPIAVRKLAEGIPAAPGGSSLLHIQDIPFWDRYWRSECADLSRSSVAWIAAQA
jgi:exosortase A-associated hydrolase 2